MNELFQLLVVAASCSFSSSSHQ